MKVLRTFGSQHRSVLLHCGFGALLTFAFGQNVLLLLLREIPKVAAQFMCIDCYLWVHPCTTLNCSDSDVESRGVVAEHHVERRGSGTFLVVSKGRDIDELESTRNGTRYVPSNGDSVKVGPSP